MRGLKEAEQEVEPRRMQGLQVTRFVFQGGTLDNDNLYKFPGIIQYKYKLLGQGTGRQTGMLSRSGSCGEFGASASLVTWT